MRMVSPTARWLNKVFGPQRALALAGSFHRVFSGKDGDAVLDALRHYCHIYDTTAFATNTGAVDPVQMQINEGRRQAYLFIVSTLQVTAEELKQPKESADERAARRDDNGPEPKPRWGNNRPDLDGPADPARPTAGPADE